MKFIGLIIKIIHIMLILFMILAPFSNIMPLLILHITGSWCLLVHWLANNDICFLTMMEGKLRNIDYRKGFLHQFISPIYNISDKSLSKLCHFVVILTMSISIYNFLNSNTYENVKQCYHKNGSFIDCIKLLFIKI
jgi:uncharacterized membrane protein YjgN (DUF898 family)